MCFLVLDMSRNGICSSQGFSLKAFVLLEISGSSFQSMSGMCMRTLFFFF
jgi:hypothetical protein